MSRAGALLQVQHDDDRLAGLRERASALEADLAGSPELERARAAAAQLERMRAAAEASVAQVEATAAALRARVGTLDRHLYSGAVRNPAELVTLQQELDAVRAELAAVEEEELRGMEAAEIATTAAHDAASRLSALEDSREAERAPQAGRLAVLHDLITAAAADRAAAAVACTSDDLALYTRLASRVRPAVVQLDGESCGGCHLPMAHHEAREVLTGDAVRQCSNCDRILAP